MTGPVDNIPRLPETLDGLRRLCRDVLDPIVDQFGRIELTYGFAGRHLTRLIRGGIEPSLDQHAGSEVGRGGILRCGRRGQAADLIIAGVPSHTAARWVAMHTPFDRLYFYGSDRPIHVSVGPDESRMLVWMRRTAQGRRVPRMLSAADLPADD